jgi:hypothetical protein
MKIGILTLPLHHNYGGIIQVYALMTNLKELGYDPILIRREHQKPQKWRYPFGVIKRIIQKFIFKIDVNVFEMNPQKSYLQNLNNFINTNLTPQSYFLYTTNEVKKYCLNGFDAFVVGSDQVWREEWHRNWKMNFFFDFVDNPELVKLSYAASFGIDTWNYNNSDTQKIKHLISQFRAVSVREDSAVRLCEEYLDIKAQHLVDPVLLLLKECYLKLISSEDEVGCTDLFTYILDYNPRANDIIETASKYLQMKSYSIFENNEYKNMEQINYIMPSISRWLACFNKAKYIITDSYHGCVFAIVFNKPFIVIGNEFRGQTRFKSILKLFGLEDRFVGSLVDNNLSFLNSNIDWKKINLKIEQERIKSNQFFTSNLN